MHISEGILSGTILVNAYLCALTGTAIGLKKVKLNAIAETGVLSAAFFVFSLIHIPIGFSNAHLTLSGLLGILLGWASFPAIITALILQAVMFQYGGITTLGINTIIIAVPSIISHYIFNCLVKKKYIILPIVAFVCGAFSVFMGVTLTSVSLIISNSHFKEIAIYVIIAHIPIMIIEGIITAFCISFFIKVKPEIMSINLFN